MPGVYAEGIFSGVGAITGVSTWVAAFIDFLKRGLLNKANLLVSMGDFRREIGELGCQMVGELHDPAVLPERRDQ